MGIRFIDVETGHHWIRVCAEGDSNTNAGFPGGTWVNQIADLLDTASEYSVLNRGESGKKVYTMVQNGAINVDAYYMAGHTNICLLLGGYNDTGTGTSQDSTYTLIKEFCNDRRAAGWYMIIMTYPNSQLSETNDSIQANWTTFADDMIDLAEAPYIGEAADHSDTTYYRDIVHMSIAGFGIVADSVYKHLEALR